MVQMIQNDTMSERKKLILNTLQSEHKQKRVPLISNDRTYKIFDAGYKLSECLYNYDNMEDCVYKFHEKYQFDSYFDLGARCKFRISDCFDAVVYELNDEEGYINYRDRNIGEDVLGIIQEYKEKGHFKFGFENMMKYRYNVTDRNDLAKRIANAGKETLAYFNALGKIRQVMIGKYNVPVLYGDSMLWPCEALMTCGILGIKLLSLAMRRYAEPLEDMLLSVSENWQNDSLKSIENFTDKPEVVFPYICYNLAHSIMNPKQFERFYWSSMKWLGNELAKHDLKCFVQAEGFLDVQFDFYKELPKDIFAFLIEMNSPQQVKQELPNVTVVGGYPTSYLANKSKQECLDKAKELLDTVAADGRWIYSSDKMLSYKNDVRAENMVAVNHYILENGVY